jgi:hypothetical protein
MIGVNVIDSLENDVYRLIVCTTSHLRRCLTGLHTMMAAQVRLVEMESELKRPAKVQRFV